jgi:hypothetical protein
MDRTAIPDGVADALLATTHNATRADGTTRRQGVERRARFRLADIGGLPRRKMRGRTSRYLSTA